MAGTSSSAVLQQIEQRRTFEEQTLQMAKLLMDEKTRLVSTESLLAQVTQARGARNLRGMAFLPAHEMRAVYVAHIVLPVRVRVLYCARTRARCTRASVRGAREE